MKYIALALALLGGSVYAEEADDSTTRLSGSAEFTVEDSPKSELAEVSSRVILFFGDSLTAGYGLDREQAFPALVQARIDSIGWNFEVFNAGLGGETSAGGLRRIDWLLRRPIDVFVLELGANDGLRGIDPKDTHANLQQIVERVKAKNPKVAIVIAGMQMPPNMGVEYTEAFAAIFPALAKENDAALIPFLLEGVADQPALNLPDGNHPNVAGHQIVAETVWTALGPVLEELRR